METALASHLTTCAAAYAKAKGLEVSTVARLAANDWRFFDRLDNPDRTFTIRKYDEVVLWFWENWPSDLAWPQTVPPPALNEKRRVSA